MLKKVTLAIIPLALLASIFAGRDPVGAVHGTGGGLFGSGAQPLEAGQ